MRVGVVGIGQMGTDLVTQIGLMDGITVAAIADRSGGGRAKEAFAIAGPGAGEFRVVGKAGEIAGAIEDGVTAVHEDARAVCDCDLIDVVIDATGRPSAGAEIGLYALRAGRHMVMMNVEADVTVGPILHKTARECGVLYSVGAGDEPTSVMELIEFVSALGYPVVAAGKGKNNPLNVDAVPDDGRSGHGRAVARGAGAGKRGRRSPPPWIEHRACGRACVATVRGAANGCTGL